MTRRGHDSERTCIVSRQPSSPEGLIRFVAAPDGTVVADLRRRLPGRGVWVTADAAHVRAAEERRLIERGLGEGARVAPGMAGRIADRLREAAVASLSMARKAGTAIAGFTRVEAALAGSRVVALIHAGEASPEGIEKLAAAARRNGAADVPVIRLFATAELDLAFGRANVIHAALLAGPASANVLKSVRAFANFVGEDSRVGGLEPDQVTRPQDRRNS